VFALATSGALLAFWRVGWLLLHRVGLEPGWPEGFNELLRFGSPEAAAMRAFSSVVLAPFGEELLYRGALFGALRSRLSLHRAALFSGLVFAAVHGYGLLGSTFVALSGYLWARLAARTGSLWPAMLSHALVNLSVELALLSRR
jgi:membrane protease YdiL (CAAX protease family)